MVDETLHRTPGLEQSHAAVVTDLAVLIPRILVVTRLKSKWSVTEIEIQILDPKSAQARLESRFGALGPMIRIPQFCRDKQLFTRNPSGGKSCAQGFTHLPLIPVPFRAI